eukprot:9498909-Pyramimonas_sp.AAC.1
MAQKAGGMRPNAIRHMHVAKSEGAPAHARQDRARHAMQRAHLQPARKCQCVTMHDALRAMNHEPRCA